MTRDKQHATMLWNFCQIGACFSGTLGIECSQPKVGQLDAVNRVFFGRSAIARLGNYWSLRMSGDRDASLEIQFPRCAPIPHN